MFSRTLRYLYIGQNYLTKELKAEDEGEEEMTRKADNNKKVRCTEAMAKKAFSVLQTWTWRCVVR